MLFNSYIFIFLFLPVCLVGYYILQKKSSMLTKLWLIGCSLWFYGYFNLSYLLIMLGSVAINYLIYSLIRRGNKQKLFFICGIVVNLGVLFYFKYYDFFIENVNAVFKVDIALKHILLPLGISFFTFQQISFLYDVYKGEIRKIGLVDYSLFVTFFPQLIAGPIVTGQEMLPQFAGIGSNSFDADRFQRGIVVFTGGLFKKVLIADTFAKAVDYGFSNLNGINATEAMLVMLFYTIQLYFDFSGYCDMAIGIGKMFGIDIALNFNSPYKAANIVEFWKRWHITLSRFFTKNVYIPLGGNRRGVARTYINTFIIFFLSGLWHGAGWNFVIWGCMHGIMYILTKMWLSKIKRGNKFSHIIGVIVTFIFVNVAWVFFRAPSVNEAALLIKTMLAGQWAIPAEIFAEGFNLGEMWYVMKILHIANLPFARYYLMVLFAVVTLIITFCAPNIHEAEQKMKFNSFSAIIVGALLVWCIVSLSGVSTFLYFNF